MLPAGTYVFKLLNSSSNRHIVQIFNKDQTKIYATILAIPNYRLQPKDKTVITFNESVKGAPQAIRAWFYPGANWGEEFVYPKAKAWSWPRRPTSRSRNAGYGKGGGREARRTAGGTGASSRHGSEAIGRRGGNCSGSDASSGCGGGASRRGSGGRADAADNCKSFAADRAARTTGLGGALSLRAG